MTLAPPYPVSDREALVRLASWTTWPGWEKFLLCVCSAFHLLIGSALIGAPAEQVINAGTAPVFELAPRWVWGVASLFAGVASLLLLWHRSAGAQIATWLTVIPLGSAWCGAFWLALASGRGSALGAVIFPTLYVIFGTVAVRIGLGKR